MLLGMANLTKLDRGTEGEGRYHWRCEIPDYWPRGPNKTNRMHWAPGVKESRTAFGLVLVHGGRGLDGLPAFDSPVCLMLTRVYAKHGKKLDPTNLAGSVKRLEDVLRLPRKRWHKQYQMYVPERFRHGIIVDDRPEDFVGGKPIVEQRRADDGKKLAIIEIVGRLRDRRMDPVIGPGCYVP